MGLDGEINYLGHAFNRLFNLRLLANYQPHYYIKQPGVANQDLANTYINQNNVANPMWRATAMMHVEPSSRFTVDLRERWRSSMRVNSDPTVFYTAGINTVFYTDLTVTAKVFDQGKVEIYGNITNLFNTAPRPAQAGTLPGMGWMQGDDHIDRYFTIGASARC